MTTYQNPLVIGVFQSESDAKHAIEDLRSAGFAKDQIGFAMREGGAITTNLLNDLMNLGVPQDRANFYNQHYTAGHAVISVRADGREPEVANILSTDGATGFNDTLDDYYDKSMHSNSTVDPTTAGAYNNTAPYNDPNVVYDNTGAATRNNPNAAYNDPNAGAYNNPNAAYNDPNAAAYNNPDAAYDNPAYEGNRVDFTDQDRAAMMNNEAQASRRPAMGNQQGEEARVDRNGNPRIQTNDNTWANAERREERQAERDTRNNNQ